MKFTTITAGAALIASAMGAKFVVREAVSPKAGVYVSRSDHTISNVACPERLPYLSNAPGQGQAGVWGNRYWSNDTYISMDGSDLLREWPLHAFSACRGDDISNTV
jgi:hypothetical protein